MSKKFTVAFATLTIMAESIDEALQKAKTEARIIQITDNEAFEPGQVHTPDLSDAPQDTRPVPEVAENEFAAAGFIEGKSYYSETEAWMGTIGGRPGNGVVSVSLENLNNGRTERREFRLTANNNLRSTTGNIVLYADKPVDEEDGQD